MGVQVELRKASEKSDWIGWLRIDDQPVLVQLPGTLVEELAQKIFKHLSRP